MSSLIRKKKLKLIILLFGVLVLNCTWAQSNALNFDGINDYVQWGDPEQGFPGPYAVTPIVEPLVGSDFTIELWIKSDFTFWPGPHGVLWAYNSYNPNHASNRLILGINTSGRLYIHDGLNNGLSVLRWTGSTDVTDGECHHIAFTHDASAKITNIYVDGLLTGASISTTFVLEATDVFNLGQEWDDLDGEHAVDVHEPSQLYYGDMDDIRIWTEEREIDEIADNQDTDFLPGEPNLLADFKVDQGIFGGDNTSELFLDNSSLTPSLDGVLTGFAKLGTTSNFVLDECDPCFAGIDAGDNLDVCEGEEVTLTASGGGMGVIYTWSDGVVDGFPFTPTETVTYTVTGTGPGDCENTDTVTVTANPLPIIDAGLDTSVCEGEEVTLTGTGTSVTYDWTGGAIDGEPFVAITTATYTVTGTDAFGCQNSDDVEVTVIPLPIIDAGEDQIICEGSEVTLTAEGGGGIIYTWTGGVINDISFIPATTTTYTVIGTTIAGCQNTEEVTVTVNPLPSVDAGSDIFVCEGDEVILTGSGAGIGAIYDWTGGIIDGLSFTPISSESYSVVGTDANGCVNSDDILVTVNPFPNVNFSGLELLGCNPHLVTFTTDTPGATFSWEFGDGGASGIENPSHTYLSEGVYDVTLTVTTLGGCTRTTTYFDYVTVVPQPIADFTFSLNDMTLGESSAEFTNHSLYSESYIWNFGDGSPTSVLENPSHSFPGINEFGYEIELKAFNSLGCRDSTTKLLKIKDRLIFYVPNTFTPDGDSFNDIFQPVFISGFNIYDFHIMIFNRWGEIVFESYDANYGWNGTYGAKGLVQDGTYIWTIEFGDSTTDKKFFEEGHVNVLK